MGTGKEGWSGFGLKALNSLFPNSRPWSVLPWNVVKCTQKNHDQWQTTSLISSDSTIHFLILAPREIQPEFKTFFLHRFSFYILKTTGTGADLGGGARGSRSNPPEFKKMRHYNTLTWPQNSWCDLLNTRLTSNERHALVSIELQWTSPLEKNIELNSWFSQ